jgi:hypothetical protein
VSARIATLARYFRVRHPNRQRVARQLERVGAGYL